MSEQQNNRTHFYTVAEVARLLNVSKRTIQRRLRAGDLRGIRPPGCRQWRIAPDDLCDYLNSDSAGEAVGHGK